MRIWAFAFIYQKRSKVDKLCFFWLPGVYLPDFSVINEADFSYLDDKLQNIVESFNEKKTKKLKEILNWKKKNFKLANENFFIRKINQKPLIVKNKKLALQSFIQFVFSGKS